MNKILLAAAVSLALTGALFVPGGSAVPLASPLAVSKASKPEDAARGLYDAWKANDRRAASRVASNAAINKVFRTRYTGPGWEFNGCEKKGTGYNCFYRYEGGGVNMRVNGKSSTGYRVTSVSFIAD